MRLDERTTERLLLAYGDLPFPGGIFFILRPEVKGHQWRRDFIPALLRYASHLTGRPATKRNRLRGGITSLISGVDGFTPDEEMLYITNARDGRSAHHWAWYNPATRELEYIQGPQPQTQED